MCFYLCWLLLVVVCVSVVGLGWLFGDYLVRIVGRFVTVDWMVGWCGYCLRILVLRYGDCV